MSKYPSTFTIIVCPKAANTAFKKEFSHTNLKYSIFTSEENKEVKGSRFAIFNYSNMDKMEKLVQNLYSRNVKVIGIFDEVHVVGSADSNQAKRLRALRPMFTCVCGMTGTPLLNDIMGLYYVVDFVKPGYLGSYYEYKSTYVITKKKSIRIGGRKRQIEELIGYKDLDVLRQKLGKIIITRFVEYKINYEFRECPLTPQEEAAYQLAAQGILDTEDEQQFSARLWNLQRVADGSTEVMDKGETYSKNRLLIDVVRECLVRNEAVLIYTEIETTYTKLYDLIREYHGYLGYNKLYLITGKTPYKDRVRCEKNLKAGDIVIVTKAGNKAINLQAANNVVFYDIPFAVGDYIQMVGRITRVDTVYDHQNVYMLEAKNTIDTYKRLSLQSNMNLIQSIFGKSCVMPYYGDVDKDVMRRYRQYFKNNFLWRR